jgi:hypothetical protein
MPYLLHSAATMRDSFRPKIVESVIEDIDDLIKSKPAEDNKELPEHEQSTVDPSYIIQNLTVEYQTICDPCVIYCYGQ